MGTLILATTTSSKGGSNPAFTFIIFAALIGVFYFAFMRPNRNRRRQVMQAQSAVMPGQRIRTTAGMYGTVVSGDDRDVVIEIAPGVHVTMLRRAVMEVVADDTMPTHEDIGDDEAEEPEDAEEPAAETPAEHEDSAPGDDSDLKDRNI